MKIRTATPDDHDAIRDVVLDAFDTSERVVVAQVAIDLLGDATAQPVLALVAEDNNSVDGVVLFSRVWIMDQASCSCFILCPLGVRPSAQGHGIGGKLIAEGVQRLQSLGADLVFVLGDPKYYGRHGFSADHCYEPPYPLAYPEAWMVRLLNWEEGCQSRGKVRCSSTLESEELW